MTLQQPNSLKRAASLPSGKRKKISLEQTPSTDRIAISLKTADVTVTYTEIIIEVDREEIEEKLKAALTAISFSSSKS